MSDIPIIGVAIILMEKDGFLFELQGQPKWKSGADGVLEIGMSCIGGTVEEGESLAGALKREAIEEIGCRVAFDPSPHPFSMDPAGNVSPLAPGSVPDGVQFLWEGNDPGYVPGAKVAVYAGRTVGRTAPGDLSAIATLKPGLFLELATKNLTVEGLQRRGGILGERKPVPRSARVKPVGTAARLLTLRKRHPDLLQALFGRKLIPRTYRMNEIHEANRRRWNDMAADWEDRLNREGLWRRCHKEPGLAFEGGTLETIREMMGTLRGRRVCVIGSGDNLAAYALAGLGARVTSTDISEERLKLAADRAEALDLSIDFVRSDAADLDSLPDSGFDLVCSTNGFFVWIDDLEGVFSEVARILRPGGIYVFYDIHPFTRPWIDQAAPIEMAKPFWDTGPFHGSGEDSYEHHWTLADLLNPLAQVGLVLKKVVESPARDAAFWRGGDEIADAGDSLLDWRIHPRAGLPAWLTVAASAP